MSFFRINGTLLKNLFGKQPADPESLQTPEGIRGSVSIETGSCALCGECEEHCIVGAIRVNGEDETWEINRMQCILCGECTEICPQECLHMSDFVMEPEFAVIADVFQIGEEEEVESAEDDETAGTAEGSKESDEAELSEDEAAKADPEESDVAGPEETGDPEKSEETETPEETEESETAENSAE